MSERMLDDILRLTADRDRLTAQLTLERTASNRTIDHLVARKDSLEARVQELEEGLDVLRAALQDIRDGFVFRDEDVQNAIQAKIRAALEWANPMSRAVREGNV